MIAEALKAIETLVGAAAMPKLLKEFPTEAIYVVNGEQLTVEIPAPPREHQVSELDDLIRLAARFAGEKDLPKTMTPVVWYDADEIVLVLDDDGHRVEKATMDLQFSDVFKVLVALRRDPKAAWKSPRDFVRLIRIELAGAFGDNLLLNAVRKVRFDNGVATTAENSRNRESLGKTLTSTLDVEVPEAVTLDVAVFNSCGVTWTFPVRCTVETNPLEGNFQLLPFPDEIERVVQLAVAAIADRLGHGLPESVPAYHGKPE
jgi:hypothetical protein